MINDSGRSQESRLAKRMSALNDANRQACDQHSASNAEYNTGMDMLSERAQELSDRVVKTRESVKSKVKGDFAVSARNKNVWVFKITDANRLPIPTSIPSEAQRHPFTIQRSKSSIRKCHIWTRNWAPWTRLSRAFVSRTTHTTKRTSLLCLTLRRLYKPRIPTSATTSRLPSLELKSSGRTWVLVLLP